MHLWVNANLIKELTIDKGTVDFPRKNGAEVDDMLGAVLKADA